MSSARALADRLWDDVPAPRAGPPIQQQQPHTHQSVDFVNDWLKRRGLIREPIVWGAADGGEAKILELLRIFSDLIVTADT